jgi:hypothetical protein
MAASESATESSSAPMAASAAPESSASSMAASAAPESSTTSSMTATAAATTGGHGVRRHCCTERNSDEEDHDLACDWLLLDAGR